MQHLSTERETYSNDQVSKDFRQNFS